MATRSEKSGDETATAGFARRLREAMLDAGYRSRKHSGHGVDVVALMPVAGVTYTAAWKYVTGRAFPHEDKIKPIAQFLNVNVPWLRDGIEPKRAQTKAALRAQEPAVAPYQQAEADEFAQLFMKLPPERRAQFRDVVALAALAAREPWLRMGQFDPRETFDEYEYRIVRDFKFYQRMPRPGKKT